MVNPQRFRFRSSGNSGDDSDFDERLSRISTRWTVLRQAHRPDENLHSDAVQQFIERYHCAVYRYLLGALRDSEAAEELFQEFAVRFLKGGFRNADPQRGRFRDFLKRSLINLVHDYRKRPNRKVCALDGDVAAECSMESDNDALFVESWREELLARAWSELSADQERGGVPYYSVLRLRADNPDMSSGAMAQALNQQLRPTPALSDAGVRKILQRARERFAELLLQEVARSLGDSSRDALEQELASLRLLPYCQTALARLPRPSE
jgi:RNA polymerase sigma factor (sigma-70 family)